VTLLAELVRASQRVGATPARTAKVRELSSLLRSLAPEEIDTGVHYLSGEIPQGKIGVGYSAVRATASSAAADAETLSIADVAEALEEIHGEVAFEWKMDGARIQVHKLGDEVRIYTRSLNEISAAIPEIVELARTFSAHALVLDGEAIAFDARGRPHPFQVTMKRFGRKLNVAASRSALPIQAFFFDCLKVDDESLAGRSTAERFTALAGTVPAPLLIPRLVTSSEPEARAFYEAGNRGASWLKIKRVHTLDLVVLAAEWGYGRRTGKLSNLHLGALDSKTGEYVMLGKTFKGLTDATLDWQTQQFLARELRRDPGTVYVRPELVVEIAFSDLQASIRYPGGLALRLARVKRYRDDKRAEEADTMDAVRKIYTAQASATDIPFILR
jgi:DNA ligase 1